MQLPHEAVCGTKVIKNVRAHISIKPSAPAFRMEIYEYRSHLVHEECFNPHLAIEVFDFIGEKEEVGRFVMIFS